MNYSLLHDDPRAVDVSELTREEAIYWIKNKCNNCDGWLYCNGFNSHNCNDKVSYLIEKFSNKKA